MQRLVLDRDLNQMIEENSRKAWENRENVEREKSDQEAENSGSRTQAEA